MTGSAGPAGDELLPRGAHRDPGLRHGGCRGAVEPARTAWFYIVNAWLREYVAVLTYRRRPALACAGIAGVFAALYALLVLGTQRGLIG